ncbi:hypothetical protein CMQ_7932 [Grosmannia clavigera kw1407]|uniref:Uncharacterized protein n=1 Tax=Grosmannia clavigera (strain kw1407 / UAMH 11150) TaxID=655863 RepID=F0XS48_GROCL|nr:uncharacterized protein CMQ_7932 [Grosmannia clavigera kw1407]EFW99564.1 hypothetical protein CMQ_7932 [Grosmannia clavigera kw1407]
MTSPALCRQLQKSMAQALPRSAFVEATRKPKNSRATASATKSGSMSSSLNSQNYTNDNEPHAILVTALKKDV